MSAADKARHYRLGHGGKRGIERKETTNDKTPRLTCDICSVSFVTHFLVFAGPTYLPLKKKFLVIENGDISRWTL